jgi:hypothetical protein
MDTSINISNDRHAAWNRKNFVDKKIEEGCVKGFDKSQKSTKGKKLAKSAIGISR